MNWFFYLDLLLAACSYNIDFLWLTAISIQKSAEYIQSCYIFGNSGQFAFTGLAPLFHHVHQTVRARKEAQAQHQTLESCAAIQDLNPQLFPMSFGCQLWHFWQKNKPVECVVRWLLLQASYYLPHPHYAMGYNIYIIIYIVQIHAEW